MEKTPNKGKQTNYAKRVILALCALFIAALTACTEDEGPEAAKPFVPGPRNPFITDRFTADPAAFLDDDGTVYIVCGEDTLPPDAPSNEYYRISKWHIYSTKDMKTFKYENVLMNSEDFTYGQKNSAWASQAIKGEDGRYYFYGTILYSLGGYEQVISVAKADKPTGPWEQAGNSPLVRSQWTLADTGASVQNIDPTVFIDDDGTAWLSWSQVSPRIAKLKENMIEIERPIKLLFPSDWKTQDRYEEGPFLYKRNGIYYMIYASNNASEGAESISYSMAREDPDNPGLGGLIGKSGAWSDGVPITGCAPAFSERNSFTIHPAVLDFKGQTYLFYHNAALQVTQEDGSVWNGATGRRSLCVDYLYFNEDGTIQFVDVRNPAGLSVPPKN
jgi:beta-xylosidase